VEEVSFILSLKFEQHFLLFEQRFLFTASGVQSKASG